MPRGGGGEGVSGRPALVGHGPSGGGGGEGVGSTSPCRPWPFSSPQLFLPRIMPPLLSCRRHPPLTHTHLLGPLKHLPPIPSSPPPTTYPPTYPYPPTTYLLRPLQEGSCAECGAEAGREVVDQLSILGHFQVTLHQRRQRHQALPPPHTTAPTPEPPSQPPDQPTQQPDRCFPVTEGREHNKAKAPIKKATSDDIYTNGRTAGPL